MMKKIELIAKLMELYDVAEEHKWYDLSAKLNIKIKQLIDEVDVDVTTGTPPLDAAHRLSG